MSKFFVEVKYPIVESVYVEADDFESAEEKALELVQNSLTNRDFIDDYLDEAEVIGSKEAQHQEQPKGGLEV